MALICRNSARKVRYGLVGLIGVGSPHLCDAILRARVKSLLFCTNIPLLLVLVLCSHCHLVAASRPDAVILLEVRLAIQCLQHL